MGEAAEGRGCPQRSPVRGGVGRGATPWRNPGCGGEGVPPRRGGKQRGGGVRGGAPEPGRRWGGGRAASRNPRKGGLPCKAVSSRSCPSASGDLMQKTDHQLVHPGPGSAGSPAAAPLPGFPGASCGHSDHFPEAHPSPACSSGLGPPGVGITPLQRPLGGCAVLGTPHRPPHSQAQ